MRPWALVTGASSGLGMEFARILARDGHDLILVARSEDTLRGLASELSSRYGADCTVLPADLSRPGAGRSVWDRVREADLVVDVLINSAGFGDWGAFHQADLDKQLRMIQVNITALTELTRLVLPGMVERGQGRVLNLSSTAAFQPGPLMAVYFATKVFVLHLSQALAHELRKTGVTVTAFCPGPTDSGFLAAAGLGPSRLFRRRLPTSAAMAAAGYRAMMAGRRVYIPGWRNYLLAEANRLVPRPIAVRIVAWMTSPAKP